MLLLGVFVKYIFSQFSFTNFMALVWMINTIEVNIAAKQKNTNDWEVVISMKT